jgi:hypothetical protein
MLSNDKLINQSINDSTTSIKKKARHLFAEGIYFPDYNVAITQLATASGQNRNLFINVLSIIVLN